MKWHPKFYRILGSYLHSTSLEYKHKIAWSLLKTSTLTQSSGSEPEFDKSDGDGSGAGWDVDEDLELPPDLDINVTTVTGSSYNPPAIGTSTAKVWNVILLWACFHSISFWSYGFILFSSKNMN